MLGFQRMNRQQCPPGKQILPLLSKELDCRLGRRPHRGALIPCFIIYVIFPISFLRIFLAFHFQFDEDEDSIILCQIRTWLICPFFSHCADICLRFTFTNDAGVPFMLYSSLKRDGYLVTGPEIRLKYVIKNRQFMGLARLPDKRGHIFGAATNIISEVGFL